MKVKVFLCRTSGQQTSGKTPKKLKNTAALGQNKTLIDLQRSCKTPRKVKKYILSAFYIQNELFAVLYPGFVNI